MGHSIVVSTAHPELTTEEQAKIQDIPFPSQIKPQKLLFTQSQIAFSYETSLSREELVEFFGTGMDYWGWEQLGTIEAAESCLLFSKPSKLCAILLRDEDQMRWVTFFITHKKKR
jgi:hypothetical protein